MSAAGATPAAMRNMLAWLQAGDRSYAETMEAWRSSCPRLSVWEDALLAGLVEIRPGPGGFSTAPVRLTAAGQACLNETLGPLG